MKEALKLALEALEDSEDHLAKPYSTDARRAIAAIKAALAQPPQRTWVGLTDDEREAIANATIRIHGQEWAYATAIEAKLKEKNT